MNGPRTTPEELAPVRLDVEVRATPATAFAAFTDRMADWWPLETHSIAADEADEQPDTQAIGVRVEGGHGGRVVEERSDGSELEWARILAWEPPHRLVLAWKPNRSERPPTELEVRFVATADGAATRVELEHRGWERLGELAGRARLGYETGWPGVLARFAALTASPATTRPADA